MCAIASLVGILKNMKKAKLREKVKRVKSERDMWKETSDFLASSIRHSIATDTCSMELQALKVYEAACMVGKPSDEQ